MAIKIKAGMLPRYGRMTMPKGTFLSNPNTDIGDNNGIFSYNPFQPAIDAFKSVFHGLSTIPSQIVQANNVFAEQQNATNAQLSNWLKSTPFGQSIQNNQFLQANAKIVEGITKPNYTPTNAFSPNAPSNQLVGSTLKNGEVSYTVLANMMRNSNLQQITQMMQDRGYTQEYRYGVGVVFVPNGQPNPNVMQSPTGIYNTGKPYGKGTLYEGGTYIQEGTPTASGESQYAVTYNNSYALNDKHGKYKMVDYVTKDSGGNWVHVYRQQLRKVYNRNSQRARAANRNKNQAPATDESINQSVNLRANYG